MDRAVLKPPGADSDGAPGGDDWHFQVDTAAEPRRRVGREDTAAKSTPLAMPTKRRGKGRPPGKHSDPDFEQVAAYIRKHTIRASRLHYCKRNRARSSVRSVGAYLPSGSRRAVDNPDTQISGRGRASPISFDHRRLGIRNVLRPPTREGRFPGVAVGLDAGNRLFTTLPVEG